MEIEFFILFDEELLDEEIEDEFDLEVYVRKICKCDNGSDSELDGNGSNNLEKVFKIVVCKVMRKIKWEWLDELVDFDNGFMKGMENEWLLNSDGFFLEFSDESNDDGNFSGVGSFEMIWDVDFEI